MKHQPQANRAALWNRCEETLEGKSEATIVEEVKWGGEKAYLVLAAVADSRRI